MWPSRDFIAIVITEQPHYLLISCHLRKYDVVTSFHWLNDRAELMQTCNCHQVTLYVTQ